MCSWYSYLHLVLTSPHTPDLRVQLSVCLTLTCMSKKLPKINLWERVLLTGFFLPNLLLFILPTLHPLVHTQIMGGNPGFFSLLNPDIQSIGKVLPILSSKYF